MNASFIKENPITAQKAAAAVQKASEWMRENPEEGVKMLMDDDKIGGDYDMNVEIWKSLEFGVSDEMTEAALEQISSELYTSWPADCVRRSGGNHGYHMDSVREGGITGKYLCVMDMGLSHQLEIRLDDGPLFDSEISIC